MNDNNNIVIVKRQLKHRFCLLFSCLVWATVINAQAPDWKVIPEDFEHSMTITGTINVNQIEVNDATAMVAAFIGGECRGVASPVYYSAKNQYIASLFVYGRNADENADIVFKYYDAIGNKTYDLPNTLEFIADDIKGNFVAPYVWTDKLTSINDNLFTDNSAFAISPNPCVGKTNVIFKNPIIDIFNLRVINIMGQIMYTEIIEIGTTEVEISGLPHGQYILLLQGNKKFSSMKLVVLN